MHRSSSGQILFLLCLVLFLISNTFAGTLYIARAGVSAPSSAQSNCVAVCGVAAVTVPQWTPLDGVQFPIADGIAANGEVSSAQLSSLLVRLGSEYALPAAGGTLDPVVAKSAFSTYTGIPADLGKTLAATGVLAALENSGFGANAPEPATAALILLALAALCCARRYLS